MPSVFDRAKPLLDFDPLVSKLNFDIGDWEQQIADAAAGAFLKFIDDVLHAIEQATGVDLTAWIEAVNIVITSLEVLFGELNPLSTSFDPTAAVGTFFVLIVTLVALSPELLQELETLLTTGLGRLLLGFLVGPGSGSIIEQLIQAMGRSGTTLADMNVIFIGLNNVMTSLGILFGELNVLAPDFDAKTAVLAFVGLLKTLAVNAPPVFAALADLIALFLDHVLDLDTWTGFLRDFTASIGGTGETIASLLAAMGAFPAANIVGGLANATMDGAHIFGILTDTVIPSLTGSWSGHIASSLLSGILNQDLVPTLTAAWGGTVAGSVINGLLAQANIPDLTGGWGGIVEGQVISGYTAVETRIIDAINVGVGRLAGQADITIEDAIQHIPPLNIIGMLGQLDIQGTIESFLNGGIQGVLQDPGAVGGSIDIWKGTLSNMAQFLGFVVGGSAPKSSVANITSYNSDLIQARAIQKAASANLDPTFEASFNLNEINVGTSLPTITVTQQKSALAFITATDGGVKESIGWLGYGVANITAFYVNVGTWSQTTGTFTKFYTSPNIISGVGSGAVPVWNSLNLAALDYIDTALVSYTTPPLAPRGPRLAVEFVVFGTGTYNLVGKTLNTQLPSHPTAIPALPASTRNILAYDNSTQGYNFNNAYASGIGSFCATTAFAVAAKSTCVVAGVAYSPVGMGADSGPGTLVAQIGSGSSWQNMTLAATNDGVLQGNRHTQMWVYFGPPTGAGIQVRVVQQTAAVNWQANIEAGSYIGPNSVGTYQYTSSAGGGALALTATTGDVNGVSVVMGVGSSSLTASGGNIRQASNVANTTPSLLADYQGAPSIAESISYTGGFGRLLTLPLFCQQPATVLNPANPLSPAVYSKDIPWCGFSGSVGVTQFSPVLTPIFGDQMYSPPGWANHWDVVAWGGGGGGKAGAGFVGGLGGGGAATAGVTLSRADISGADWTFTLAGGGTPGAPVAGNGGGGGTTVVTIPGYAPGLSAGGGFGQFNPNGAAGGGPGSGAGGITWTDFYGTDHYYPGGAGGGSAQANGQQPGGGGAGGNASYIGSFVGGGGGAPGGAYVLAYQ